MMKKLTREQEELMQVVRDEWLDKFFSLAFDEDECRTYITWLYKTFLNHIPVIIILDSPMECQVACNILKLLRDNDKLSQVSKQMWKQVSDKVSNQLRNQVPEQVLMQVSEKVTNQVLKQVLSQTRDKMARQLLGRIWADVYSVAWNKILPYMTDVTEKILELVWKRMKVIKMEYFSPLFYGTCHDYDWLAFYDFFSRIGIIKHELFDHYKAKISNIFYAIGFERIIIISRMPEYISRDEQNRLHSVVKSAIKFKDGYELFYIHGVHFPRLMFEKFILQKPTAKEVLSIKNQEQRAIIVQELGYDNIINELSTSLIHSQGSYSVQRNEMFFYELLSCKELPVRLLKVQDHTTGKNYVLGVPRTVNTCHEALEWSFKLNKGDYKNMVMES